MHSFGVHSNERACRKSGRLGLEQVIGTTNVALSSSVAYASKNYSSPIDFNDFVSSLPLTSKLVSRADSNPRYMRS